MKKGLLLVVLFLILLCGQLLREKTIPIKDNDKVLDKVLPISNLVKSAPVYDRSHRNKRDPFMPGIYPLGISASHQAQEPLKLYVLDDLKFVGTLQTDNIIWALLALPDGHILPVKRGDCLGRQHAKVLDISADSIAVKERGETRGQWKKRVIPLHHGPTTA